MVTAKMLAREERPAPRVDRLATPAVIGQMSRSAPTALAITLPSVKAALNGSLRRGFSNWRQRRASRLSKPVRLPVQRARAGQLREAAQQLLWWVPELLWRVPGAAPHHQPLAQMRYRLTSCGWRDRKYLQFSLCLQASLPNMQLKHLKLLHTNSQATPPMVHRPLANGSPVRVLPLLQRATKTILINLGAGLPDKTKKKPRLTRPPKSDSEVGTYQQYAQSVVHGSWW